MLSIGYLGTKPPVSAVLTHSRDINYDKVDEEHRALLQVNIVKHHALPQKMRYFVNYFPS